MVNESKIGKCECIESEYKTNIINALSSKVSEIRDAMLRARNDVFLAEKQGHYHLAEAMIHAADAHKFMKDNIEDTIAAVIKIKDCN